MNTDPRAFTIPIIYLVVAGGALLVGAAFPQVRARLHIKDPNAQRIVDLQKKVDDQDAKLKQAQIDKDAAVKAKEDAIKGQVQVGHEYVHGTVVELTKPQPDVATAAFLAAQADSALTVAIGDLPADKQREIEAYIALRLAGQKAEADKIIAAKNQELKDLGAAKTVAEETVKEKDRAIATVTAAKATIESQLHTVTADVVVKEKTLVAQATQLTGFGAYVSNIWFWVKIAGAIYLFVHFLMPSIDDEVDAHYPPGNASNPKWVALFHSIYNFLKTVTCAH